jgi:hypothetical protein
MVMAEYTAGTRRGVRKFSLPLLSRRSIRASVAPPIVAGTRTRVFRNHSREACSQKSADCGFALFFRRLVFPVVGGDLLGLIQSEPKNLLLGNSDIAQIQDKSAKNTGAERLRNLEH